MSKKTNMIISAVVAIAIIIAIIVLVYVNLPKQTETNEVGNHQPQLSNTTLSLIFDDEVKNLTFGEIERLESYTAKGGYRTQKGSIRGLGNYTGVNITTLINMFDPAPPLFSLLITDSEGEYTSYNFSTIKGYVNIYNSENASDPNPIGIGNMTMVLAYQFEGEVLNESSDGKLKIVFLDEKGSITNSALWWKKVVSIRIITE